MCQLAWATGCLHIGLDMIWDEHVCKAVSG